MAPDKPKQLRYVCAYSPLLGVEQGEEMPALLLLLTCITYVNLSLRHWICGMAQVFS